MAYRRKDGFYNRAKAEGFRSRAAYKLTELARSQRLIRRGDAVLDLGAWPGGWMQIAADLTGPKGLIVGVDQRPIDGLAAENAFSFAGDVLDADFLARVQAQFPKPFDVLLSDLAPSLTGIRDRDEARAEELIDAVLQWSEACLRPGGSLLIKLFMGGDFGRRRDRLRRAFSAFRITKPEATRKGSAEVYGIGKGFRVEK